MFENLAVYPKIVVTGPQRSGTRIAAKMIAADTGHEFVDEMSFQVSDIRRWREILQRERIVVQSPHMLKDVVDDPPPGIFVVLMRRDLAQIHKSEQRIQWEQVLHGNTHELRKFGLTEGDSAQIKYDYWQTHPKTVPFREVQYESIRAHPRFIPDDLRRDFGPLQTEF
jgi:hypothetical protein